MIIVKAVIPVWLYTITAWTSLSDLPLCRICVVVCMSLSFTS